ncbi:MAG: tetrahydrofolate dehydrogenase/cyclohydrolase catalytic domain-containing protein, partial [Acidobacteriota bacterium]
MAIITRSAAPRLPKAVDGETASEGSWTGMSAQLLNGLVVAEAIKQGVAARVKEIGERGWRPGLAVVLVGENPASKVYVGSKVRTC